MKDLGLPVMPLSPPEGIEPQPEENEPPAPYAMRAAKTKAAALKDRLTGPPALPFSAAQAANAAKDHSLPPPDALPGNALIIAADTVVSLNGRIFGKPAGPEEALEFLKILSGKTHEVITACAIEGKEFSEHFFVRSFVKMWDCPEELLKAYALRGEPLDKAGGYAVQGEGAFLIDCIQGSWSNVVGLPLAEIIQSLIRIKAVSV